MQDIMDIINQWTNTANQVLLNRKITNVRYLTEEEQSAFQWYSKCVVIELDDGTIVFPSRDDEGNDAGALHYSKGQGHMDVLPVI